MKSRILYVLFAFVLVSSLILAGCKPATETPAPVVEPTQPPAPTAVPPTEPPPAAYEPMMLEAPNCDYGGEFKKIEAVDEKTVKFTLCYPDPYFLAKVAFSVFSITSKENLDATGGDAVAMSEAPVGTGPYKLKEWVRGDRIIYEANPDYWGEKAFAQNLIFRWSEQSAQRLLELQSGQVDGIDNPAPEDFVTIEGDSNLALIPPGAYHNLLHRLPGSITPVR